jgi:CxxC motif-containing protein
MKHELTCIVCPRGCLIQLVKEGEQYICSGNQCKRGEVYAIQEVTEPRRMLTTTVSIVGSKLKRLPVVTSKAIRKEEVFKMIDILEKIVLYAPVQVNDVIVSNILDSGIDIVASRSIKKDA